MTQRVLLSMAVISLAGAQQDLTKRLEAISQRAMTDYDALEFEAAQNQLTQGIDQAKEAGITKAPILAELHLNLGVVYVAGLRDPYKGFLEFRRALKIDPTIQVDPAVATPELQEIFQNARDSLNKPGVGRGVCGNGRCEAAENSQTCPQDCKNATSSSVRGLVHSPIDEARSGYPIVVRAEVGADVGARRVTLFYRPAGREDFAPVPMQRQGLTSYSGEIPGAVVSGRSLHYYLEAVDRRGRAVAQSGSAASPNIISLTGGGPPPPDGGSAEQEEGPDSERRWIFGLQVGTGLGLIGFGSESENLGGCGTPIGSGTCDGMPSEPLVIRTGTAFSPVHLGAELTYRLNYPLWHVGILMRLQIVSGNEIKDFDKKTFLGMARVKRYFTEDKFRLFLSAGLGGGQLTHAVNLGTDGDNRRDSLTSGHFATGLGFGFNYNIFEDWVALVVELNSFVLLPKNTTFHFDLNAGVQFSF